MLRNSLLPCSFFTSLCRMSHNDLNEKEGFNVRSYNKKAVIAMQGEEYRSLLVVLEGAAGTEMLDPTGRRIKLETFYPGAPLAPGVLFAKDKRLPVTIEAESDSAVLSISKPALLLLLNEDPACLEFYMSLMGDKIALLAEKLRLIKFSSLQQKIAGYILNQMNYQHSVDIKLPYSREYMADLFGVARPSLSRELSRLSHAGIIELQKKRVTVKKKKALDYILAGKYGKLLDGEET